MIKKIEQAINKVEESKNILITTHISPDADAIGSSLALFNFIKKNFPNKIVNIVIDGSCPDYLKFLKNSSEIKHIKDFNKNEKFDLAFVLDCSPLERVGNVKNLIEKVLVINIDHHLDESKFDYVIKNIKASSTTQILYNFLKYFNKELDKDIAECLYAGLIQDTGNFIWNIYPETFKIASELIALGANGEKISTQLFSNNSYTKLKLIAYALSNMVYIEDKKLLYSIIPKEQFKILEANDEDTEGIIELLKSFDKAEITILIKENENIKKVSIRSKLEGADKIAKMFNGGGHSKAAGFRTDIPIEDIIKIIENL